MNKSEYIQFSNGNVICTSPTPASDVMTEVSYPVALLREIGAKLTKSTKNMAVKGLISTRFAEVIILAIAQAQAK